MKAVLPACIGVTALVFLFLAHVALGTPKPLALKVRPLIAFAPTDVYLQVRVHPQPDDRWILVVMDSGSFSRRSDWTIEPCQRAYSGELVLADCHDRTLYTFWWKDVPEGDYEIRGLIGHGDAVSASDSVTIKVQGIGQ